MSVTKNQQSLFQSERLVRGSEARKNTKISCIDKNFKIEKPELSNKKTRASSSRLKRMKSTGILKRTENIISKIENITSSQKLKIDRKNSNGFSTKANKGMTDSTEFFDSPEDAQNRIKTSDCVSIHCYNKAINQSPTQLSRIILEENVYFGEDNSFMFYDSSIVEHQQECSDVIGLQSFLKQVTSPTRSV